MSMRPSFRAQLRLHERECAPEGILAASCPFQTRVRPIFTLEDWARVLVQRNWPAMSASGTKRASRLQVVGQLIRAAANE